MSYNDNRLIVGALDRILAFDVTDNLFEKLQDASAMATSNGHTGCLNDGRKPESCRNYNRVLLPLPDNRVLSCGTNAYETDGNCQIREIKDLSESRSLSAEGLVPINESALNTAVFSDNRIFAGSMISADPTHNAFVVSSAKLGRNAAGQVALVNSVASKPTGQMLNKAKFIASFTSGEYAYFLFQEIDYIYTDSEFKPVDSQKIVSRIGRVCKEDVGKQLPYEQLPNNANLWQTFVKSRIYCENKVLDPTFGEQVFTYNRVDAAVMDNRGFMYATFSEGDVSACGSVVCRFNLTEIDRNFDTSRYYNFNANSNSRPKVQERTPPTCASMADTDSADIFDRRLTVDEVTSPEPPLFLQSGPQFTKLLVDNNLRNSSNPVIFIGTNMGKVLKVTWKMNGKALQPILIESMQVARGGTNSNLAVNFLAFEKPTDPNYLFVGTGTSVSKVVIPRCLRFPKLTQSCCYATLDPYCGWCAAPGTCTSRADCNSDWIQSDTAEATDSTCETEASPSVTNEVASWKTVAIVMAILCGIFVLISALLALNLARKWCCVGNKPAQKIGNNNLQHSYNPLSTHGAKQDDFSDRIPVYNRVTNNV